MAITAVVLAGGMASRLGGIDKPLVEVAGRALIDRTIDRVVPQVDDLVISYNRNFDNYYARGRSLVMDHDHGQGPIAGILAARPLIRTRQVLIVPADTPLLPLDLVALLDSAAAPLAVPRTPTRRQNLVALLVADELDDLGTYYQDGGRAMRQWLNERATAEVPMAEDAFVNVNTAADLERLEEILAARNDDSLALTTMR